ncbi:MAG: hypothetical protein FJX11_07045 [Alphaproteobacteria bacterium]|nr:hypothetical protein [Alphaproteobacteria bacterium]
MNDNTLHARAMALVDILLSVPDEIGIYEVYADVKFELGVTDDREIRHVALEIVREMLRRGARADFDCAASVKTYQPEKTVDEVMARIEREWDALEEPPTIGDICIFEWTPEAMEADRGKTSVV